MKKSIKFILLPVLIVLLFASIFIALYFFIFKDDNKIKSLVITDKNIVLEVGSTKDLKECYVVTPSSASIYVMCYINDASFAEINSENIIYAKSEGITTILIKCDVDNKIVEEEISLTVIEKQVIPNEFSFEKDTVTLSLTTLNCVNKIVCLENYNVKPIIEYSTNNICEYDYTTGLIIPKTLGRTIVTVKFIHNGNIVSNNFTVNVKENYITIQTNLTKVDEYYILELNKNTSGFFVVKSINSGVEDPSIKLKYEFITNLAEVKILQFESNTVALKGIQIGESILKIYCEEDESIFINIKIKVV